MRCLRHLEVQQKRQRQAMRYSFNELMVLNVETGHTSPKDYLHAVAVRENAGTHSYSQTSDYISHIESVMKDMKTL